ncbi:PREDICTED: pollen receptor-like kinase 4 [Ipomoea nil]|uniref:pollen receptor-like kinase 4 n=1 Tax=Ipomoea nil TaxID=35883 RepID=UPI0009013409|nr:PREDICTED: pollen receptor-like kinase 4 [Ipomoea nil]
MDSMSLCLKLLLMLHVSCLLVTTSLAAPPSVPDLLLKFRDSLTNASQLSNWSLNNVPYCKEDTPVWTGLICRKGQFVGLKLEGMGLAGKIDVETLSQLNSLSPLRSISVMNNNFAGPFPDVEKLHSLRGLFLSNNRFSGEIPDGMFSGMNAMMRVLLANNQFTGRIPSSLTGLGKLIKLKLQNNQFEGPIPDFAQKDLDVDFSNNRLEGPIPLHLSGKNAGIFAGNPKLCGKPLKVECPPEEKKKKTFPKIAIIIAAVAGVLLVATLLALLVRRRRRRSNGKVPAKSNVRDDDGKFPIIPRSAAEHSASEIYSRGGEKGKLSFVRADRETFELEDLLRAPAEVLGSGSFGSSYKAMVVTGSVVVRRFRQMTSVGKDEFYGHMTRLGRLSHPNLLPLVAFYYRKEEKLLISDFVEKGSLASLLHSKKASGQQGLDWPTRLKIIKGVAKGLSYLYEELSTLTLPHGHLKSSNVLLDQTFNPLIADYALAPVTNKDHAQQFMVAYKSPESTHHDRVTRKTDVWSLGILILELLTGRFPANYLAQGKGASADLAAWVNSVVREEWTGEVFDKEMGGGKSGEGEMLKLLKIGMCCCEWEVGRRWDIMEAVERIEELKEKDVEDDYSFGSDGDLCVSAMITDEDFSFSKTA